MEHLHTPSFCYLFSLSNTQKHTHTNIKKIKNLKINLGTFNRFFGCLYRRQPQNFKEILTRANIEDNSNYHPKMFQNQVDQIDHN